MRIGIIAIGRSGGYNLSKWIGLETDTEFIHEPLINGIKTDIDNVVIKWLYDEWIGLKDTPVMDKWIGLIRENERECAISHIRGKETDNWRNGYELSNEWIREREDEIKIEIEIIKGIQKGIHNIKELELIVSYEGIYNRGEDIQRIKDYIGIENTKYLHLLDSSNRLRKTKETPTKRLI
jgi:hypothetical protein